LASDVCFTRLSFVVLLFCCFVVLLFCCFVVLLFCGFVVHIRILSWCSCHARYDVHDYAAQLKPLCRVPAHRRKLTAAVVAVWSGQLELTRLELTRLELTRLELTRLELTQLELTVWS
jgi:hypothetical protein